MLLLFSVTIYKTFLLDIFRFVVERREVSLSDRMFQICFKNDYDYVYMTPYSQKAQTMERICQKLQVRVLELQDV